MVDAPETEPTPRTGDSPTLEDLQNKYMWIRKTIAVSGQSDKDYERSRNRLKSLLKSQIDDKPEPDFLAEDGKLLKNFTLALANVLILALYRLDYVVLHHEWLPSWRRVVAEHKTDELNFEVLGKMFQICLMHSKPLI